jgi:RNA polymerase sigma-70 factor (ECF subfamily)
MDSDAVLEQSEAVGVAIARFLELPPAQRGCVVLKDVLGHSLEETGLALEMTLPAVKAALHRGRGRLRALAATPDATPAQAFHPTLARYAALFNARDWDGIRALLAEDVKLDVVSRERRSGASQVGQYFGNYSRVHDWHARLVWLDGGSVIAISRQDGPDYVIELSIETGRVTQIRDFRYVPYITQDAVFEPAE